MRRPSRHLSTFPESSGLRTAFLFGGAIHDGDVVEVVLKLERTVGRLVAPLNRSAIETVGVVACFSVSVMVRMRMRPILPASE